MSTLRCSKENVMKLPAEFRRELRNAPPGLGWHGQVPKAKLDEDKLSSGPPTLRPQGIQCGTG